MEEVRLNWIEKKTYKALYNTIEKLLKVCYEIVINNEVSQYSSYDYFCNYVNDKLKGN